MQSVQTLLKLAQLRWTGHVTRMPDICQRKCSMENYKWANAPMVFRRSDIKTPSKPPARISTFQQYGNKLHRTKQSGEASSEEVLVNIQQKRISEVEQKGAQRKARAKASPTELSCYDLGCSICNRQFRARIGLISHLRTHKQ